MSDNQQFDLLIIGSGEAGKNPAWTMAKAGVRFAHDQLRATCFIKLTVQTGHHRRPSCAFAPAPLPC